MTTTKNDYTLTYGPPLTVKDEPHRDMDTMAAGGGAEIVADAFGSVTVVNAEDAGQIIEPEEVELSELC